MNDREGRYIMYKESLKNKIQKSLIFILPILGSLIFISFLALVYFWEFYGRERFLYKDVIVATQDIQKGTVIKEDMVKKIKVEESKVIEKPITDVSIVIGKAASEFIPKGAQLHKIYLEDPELVMKDGEFIFRIPNKWIEAIPGSIRRKDNALLYAVDSDEKTNPDEAYVESEIDTNELDNSPLPTYDETKVDNLIEVLENEPVIEAIVAYVKDSANREVITTSEQERIDGSSVISEINIIASIDDIKVMEEQIKQGKKFLIMYK